MSTSEAAWINTQHIFIAASTLVFYDHLITIDQEISCFWTGKWNVSRLLFFGVKSPVAAAFVSLTANALVEVPLTRSVMLSAALAIRVWYLLTRKRFLQNAIAVLALACMISTVTLVASIPGSQTQDVFNTCDYTINTRTEWRAFLPPVALHIMLYGLTLFQMLSISGEIKGLTGMMIDEYDIVALVYGLIGTAMPDDVNAFLPASYSVLVQVVMSVTVARAMLILRNLAARLHVDPGWLLSHSELSRINCRRGLRDCELLVEIQTGVEDMIEMGDCNTTGARPGLV
ncbi:hypothetical protein EDB19DRAFT_1827975 [Suillus lakei]|nr:hypothetical protein EDB19DRAFT_1827975 [Suillus lakei]